MKFITLYLLFLLIAFIACGTIKEEILGILTTDMMDGELIAYGKVIICSRWIRF